ncbi:MAG: cyoC [Candidatus Adlerbacteria bacterium]|nr:cyoC [Candidatus Adlerbacteria bacterium]
MSNHNTTDKVSFGFWAYLMSDAVLFAGLFATYAVLQGQVFGGYGIGDIVDIPFVAVESVLLLASSFTIGLALLAARHGKRALALSALLITLALGLGFLGMEVHEFAALIGEGQGPDKSAFLSAFFTLLGTHGLHVALGSLWMVVLMAHIAFKGLTEGVLRKLTCLALFWHFLDVIWIFIFTIVYMLGAL